MKSKFAVLAVVLLLASGFVGLQFERQGIIDAQEDRPSKAPVDLSAQWSRVADVHVLAVTNTTAQNQNELGNCSDGDSVWLQAGTYTLTATLTTDVGLYINGTGASIVTGNTIRSNDSTTLLSVSKIDFSGAPAGIVATPVGEYELNVWDCVFIGTDTAISFSTDPGGEIDATIEECAFEDFQLGIEASLANVSVSNCTFDTSRASFAISTLDSAHTCHVEIINTTIVMVAPIETNIVAISLGTEESIVSGCDITLSGAVGTITGIVSATEENGYCLIDNTTVNIDQNGEFASTGIGMGVEDDSAIHTVDNCSIVIHADALSQISRGVSNVFGVLSVRSTYISVDSTGQAAAGIARGIYSDARGTADSLALEVLSTDIYIEMSDATGRGDAIYVVSSVDVIDVELTLLDSNLETEGLQAYGLHLYNVEGNLSVLNTTINASFEHGGGAAVYGIISETGTDVNTTITNSSFEVTRAGCGVMVSPLVSTGNTYIAHSYGSHGIIASRNVTSNGDNFTIENNSYAIKMDGSGRTVLASISNQTVFNLVGAAKALVAQGTCIVYNLNTSLAIYSVGTISYYVYTTFDIEGQTSLNITMESSPGVVVWDGTLDQYGRAGSGLILQGVATYDGGATVFDNTSYIWRVELPDGWDFDDVNVTSFDRLIQAQLYNGAERNSTIELGINYIGVPVTNSTFETASDLISAHPSIVWISTMDPANNTMIYYFYNGLGTDFTLSYGMGLMLHSTTATVINWAGDDPIGGGYITWFGEWNNWAIWNDELTLFTKYENNNQTISDNATLGSTVTSANSIIVANHEQSLKFRTFKLSISNFTQDGDGIDMSDFTLHVYLHGVLLRNVTTTNGSACWEETDEERQMLLSWQYEFKYTFTVPAYAKSGNYSATITLDAWNDTQSTAIGVSYLTILGEPVVGGTYGDGQDAIYYEAGAIAGVSGYIPSQNVLRVQNTGNTNLRTLRFYGFSNLTNEADRDEGFSVLGGLSIRSRSADPEDDWGAWTQIGINGSNNFTFLYWPDNLLTGIRSFQFLLTSTPGDASGTYSGSFTIRATATDGTVSNVVTCYHTITISASDVQVSLKFPKSHMATVSEEQNMGSLLFQDTTPGETNVASTTRIWIQNRGELALTSIVFAFPNLYNSSEAVTLVIRDNARLISNVGATSLINGAGVVTIDLTSDPLLTDDAMSWQFIIDEIPAGTHACEFSGGFTATGIHNPGSRSWDDDDGVWYDTVAGWIGTIGNTTDITFNRSNVTFYSPLSEDQEASAPVRVTNGGIFPVERVYFVLNNVTPATYYVKDVLGNTYEPDANNTITCTLEESIGSTSNTYFWFYISTIAEGYDSTEEYDEQNVTVIVTRRTALLGSSYENVSAGTLDIVIDPTDRSFTTSTGTNYVVVPVNNGAYASASDLVAITGITWVGYWNTTNSEFVYYFVSGQGTDFPLTYGMGLVVFTIGSVSIEWNGEEVSPVSYAIEDGLNLVGNPTGGSVYANDFISGSGHVLWTARWTGTAFSYYFASGSGTNFAVPAGTSVWVRTTDGDVIEY